MLLRVSLALGLAAAIVQPAAACEPNQTGAQPHSGSNAADASCVTLDHVMAGDISISNAWARAMLPGQTAGSGFVALQNKGAAADRLVAVSSEASEKVEIHTMKVVDDIMVMRPVDGIEIAPGEMVELKPGGMHLMFTGVAQPFAEGAAVTVELTFEKAGSVEIELPVAKAGGTASDDSKQHTH